MSKKITELTAASGSLAGYQTVIANPSGIAFKTPYVDPTSLVDSVSSGTGITVDNTDPQNPIINNNGVRSISAGSNITIDNTNPNIPIVTNNGVRSVTAGTGILLGGTANVPIPSLKYSSYVCVVKVATGAITQVVVLQNEVGDGGGGGVTDIAWAVVGLNGLRAGMSSGTPFTTDKVFIVCPSVEGVAVPDPFFVVPKIVDQNNIDLLVYRRDASQTLSDGSYFVEIRVYP